MDQIKLNPLLHINCAEYLLALFLTTIEELKLRELEIDMPSGSAANFLDEHKIAVL